MNTIRHARIGLLLVAAFTLVACDDSRSSSSDSSDDSKEEKKKDLLKTLNAFERKKIKPKEDEVYDRIELGNRAFEADVEMPGVTGLRPLPPTKVDTFIHDVRLLAVRSLKMDPLTEKATKKEIGKVIAFYVKTEPDEIAGLRPYTCKEFVDSLSDDERSLFAKQLAEYIADNGFRGPDPNEEG